MFSCVLLSVCFRAVIAASHLIVPAGCAVYLIFLAAYVFYYYVRIRYTLKGGLLWYSIMILVFELMASSSMIIHGLCLLRVRIPRK